MKFFYALLAQKFVMNMMPLYTGYRPTRTLLKEQKRTRTLLRKRTRNKLSFLI
jgi:hypothetical protein